MARLASVALIILSLPAAAWGGPPAAQPNDGRGIYLLQSPDHHRFAPQRIGRTEIAPDTHVGFGIFGMKAERSLLPPVTVREIDAPKQRRAAVGFSLRF